jgi:hypothetical protein
MKMPAGEDFGQENCRELLGRLRSDSTIAQNPSTMRNPHTAARYQLTLKKKHFDDM